MAELTTLDVRYVVAELRALIGAKVEKIVQGDTEKRDVLFTLYLRDHPKIHLRFLPGMLCSVPEKPEAYPQVPPGFAMFLRKYLGGTRLSNVDQPVFDRVLRMTFESKAEAFILAIELVPPGNMILVSADGTIKNLLENQHYKDRDLRGGLKYLPPPEPFDPVKASDEELHSRITATTKNSIVTALAVELGLGGAYAEEVCVRAGVDKTGTHLVSDDVSRIITAFRSLLDMPITPHRDEKRVFPFRMDSRETTPCAQPTFLAALGSTLGDAAPAAVSRKTAAPKKNKLQSMLDAQEENLVALTTLSVAEQQAGERIYLEYALVKEIIETAQTARREKKDVTHELKRFPQVKRYDNATGVVELDMPDEVGS